MEMKTIHDQKSPVLDGEKLSHKVVIYVIALVFVVIIDKILIFIGL